MPVYALTTYGNAGHMREQVCKSMCPCARFQSAMLDKDTLTITCDQGRGEPRGSRSKKADPAKLGLCACIDKVDLVRDRFTLARQVENGEIENVQRLLIMNATEQAQHYRIGASGLPGLRLVDAPTVTVAPTEARCWVSVTPRVPPQTAAGSRRPCRCPRGVLRHRTRGLGRRCRPCPAREVDLREPALKARTYTP